ncbi:MAG: Polysaccharide biosynthesis protein [Candidatus Carbobacillus altaicus]|uniref:Polysaccharide biosynthesis protein n=1 Tax=Candidatus Carbonibacillus altaicus TaxID=2163959 RepID=A0A2R6Y3P6_9BACL|nr:MAG: Polysaccharide biosynthesis protein [Candidatus Carbobacillus altaicus]
MLLRHSLSYFLARGVAGIFNFLAIALYTRLLTPESYGLYALVMAASGLMNIVLFQWIKLSQKRYYLTYKDDVAPLLSNILSLFLLMAFLSGLVVMGAYLLHIVNLPFIAYLILLLLVWVMAWQELNLDLFTVQFRRLNFGMSTVVRASVALLIGSLLAYAGYDAYGVLFGVLLGTLLASLYGWKQNWSTITPKWDRTVVKKLFVYGFPFTFTFSFSFVLGTAGRFFIAAYMGEGATGIYSATYDFSQQTLLFLMSVINLAAYPLALQALEKSGKDKAREQIKANGTLLMSIAVPAVVGLIMLRKPIIDLMMGEAYRTEAMHILPLIVIAAFIEGIKAFHFDLAFQLGEKTSYQALIAFSGALTAIVLYVVLIPVFQLQGAAMATLGSFLVTLILSIMLGRGIFKIPFPFCDTFKIVLSTLMMGMFLAVWDVEKTSWFVLLLQMTGAIIVYGISFLILNVGQYRSELIKILGRQVKKYGA